MLTHALAQIPAVEYQRADRRYLWWTAVSWRCCVSPTLADGGRRSVAIAPEVCGDGPSGAETGATFDCLLTSLSVAGTLTRIASQRSWEGPSGTANDHPAPQKGGRRFQTEENKTMSKTLARLRQQKNMPWTAWPN